MKTIAILAIIGVAALAMFTMTSGVDSGVESQFQTFLSRHGVNYGTTEEYNFRLGVFQDNLDTIARLNAKNPRATFAVNQFADRTPADMEKRMGLVIPTGTKTTGPRTSAVGFTDADWTHMWNSVKDQRDCKSAWAFSATAAIEVRYAISRRYKHVINLLSEQQLIDCDEESKGCHGGSIRYAFDYLKKDLFVMTGRTLTKLLMVTVKMLSALEDQEINHILAFVPEMKRDFYLPSKMDQSLLLLILQYGNSTKMESSIGVVPLPVTQQLSSNQTHQKNLSPLETPGENHGERKDISEWLPTETYVDMLTLPCIQISKLLILLENSEKSFHFYYSSKLVEDIYFIKYLSEELISRRKFLSKRFFIC